MKKDGGLQDSLCHPYLVITISGVRHDYAY